MTKTLPPRRRRWSIKETGFYDVSKRKRSTKRGSKRTVRKRIKNDR